MKGRSGQHNVLLWLINFRRHVPCRRKKGAPLQLCSFDREISVCKVDIVLLLYNPYTCTQGCTLVERHCTAVVSCLVCLAITTIVPTFISKEVRCNVSVHQYLTSALRGLASADKLGPCINKPLVRQFLISDEETRPISKWRAQVSLRIARTIYRSL